jgi:hypothetical protein
MIARKPKPYLELTVELVMIEPNNPCPPVERKPEGPSIPSPRECISDGSIEDVESSPVSKVRADKPLHYSP